MEKLLPIRDEQCDCRCIHQERVKTAKEQDLSQKENEQVSALFKAMGDPNRLRILWALDREEMCVCDLALFLGVSESAVSHQLRQLRQMRLVINRREGPVLYYSLKDNKATAHIRLALKQFRQE